MMRIGSLELPWEPECIVGLDLSLRATGVAISRAGNEVKAYPVSFPGSTGCSRLVGLRNGINAAVPARSLVVLEGYAFGAAAAREALAELGGLVKTALHERGVPFLVVPPTRLKKFVTGKGNAEKSLVIKEVYKRFGVDCDDDNLADAVGLCFIGRGLVGGWEPTTDAQREVLNALRSGRPLRRKPGQDKTHR